MSFLERIQMEKMTLMKRTDSVLIDGSAVDRIGTPGAVPLRGHSAAAGDAGIVEVTIFAACYHAGCGEGVTVAVPEAAVAAENIAKQKPVLNLIIVLFQSPQPPNFDYIILAPHRETNLE